MASARNDGALVIGQILGGIFGGLFGEHPVVTDTRDIIAGAPEAAYYRYDRSADSFDVGVVVDSELISIHNYETEGDADHAAGALARHYGVGIRS